MYDTVNVLSSVPPCFQAIRRKRGVGVCRDSRPPGRTRLHADVHRGGTPEVDDHASVPSNGSASVCPTRSMSVNSDIEAFEGRVVF